MLKVVAPAKINLTLEVLKKREDGYHEIRSIVQTISLHDSLSFEPNQRTEFRCNAPDWSFEKSLVSRAVKLMREATRSSLGATIQIEKKIPLVAGLGGDSSDAAATLRGLSILWQTGLSLKDLLGLAAKLGSDVPLFIHGGTLLVEGKGERITPLSPPPPTYVVLLVLNAPKIEGKTAQLYARLKPGDYTTGKITEDFMKTLNNKEKTLPGPFNVFDSAAAGFFKGLKEYRQMFIEAGAMEVHLAGSGPTMFTLVSDVNEAEKIQRNLQRKKLVSQVAEF